MDGANQLARNLIGVTLQLRWNFSEDLDRE